MGWLGRSPLAAMVVVWCVLGCSNRERAQETDLGGDAGDVEVVSDSDLSETAEDQRPSECEIPAARSCGCEVDTDCLSGLCVVMPDGAFCAQDCGAGCVAGERCGGVRKSGGGFEWICLPAVGVQCVPCLDDLDCGDVGCSSWDGGRACLIGCDAQHGCAEGETCGEVEGGRTQCLPNEGNCACSALTKGSKKACVMSNGVGTCVGVSTCSGEAGWGECDAPAAQAETCNGVDDDCNGVVDDGPLCPEADEADECARAVCAAGVCGQEPVPGKEGLPCTPLSSCQNMGQCQGGVCVGAPVVCNDNNICTQDSCKEGKGCVWTPISAVCDDGEPCTEGDQCIQGKCMPVKLAPGCVGSCGDGNCGLLENDTACPVDCGWCGDQVCGIAEWLTKVSSCPKDCEAACGDGECEGGESTLNCLVDCSGCGDGFCGLKETGSTCILDCPASCGNKVCEATEGPAACPYDCSPSCGDKVCEIPENWFMCPEDCTVCGDHVCGVGEALSCVQDCQAECGNALCEGGENPEVCAVDCGGCGDGVCGHKESHVQCPWDCAFGCGDKVCAPWLQEDEVTCPTDCGVPDGDQDGVGTAQDNCPWLQNAGQEDLDKDGKGDVCDGDLDGDGEANLTDCAPYDLAIHHGATETCDGVDSNCDEVADPNGLCNDGLTCTADLCGGPVGCVAVPKHSSCSDGVSCTWDTCIATGPPPSGCLHQVVPDGIGCTDTGLIEGGMPSPDGRVCVSGACVCQPDCTGRICGSDGCGGTCGNCAAGSLCLESGLCQCAPLCAGRECGPDGCGGSCGGGCGIGEECNAGGTCVCKSDHVTCVDHCCPPGNLCVSGACCVPGCVGKQCGSDGCGGSCGSCLAGEECVWPGICGCLPQCAGKQCGPNGCGGVCGTCAGGFNCTSGVCTCLKTCGGAECGSDGCGGTCGTCQPGKVCSAGKCVLSGPELCPGGWCPISWGMYTMGSESSEKCRNLDLPAHPVAINSSFEVRSTELTVAEWNGALPIGPGGSVNEPVRFVSWYDALYACNALSTKEGLTSCYVLTGCQGTPGEGCLPGEEMCTGDFSCDGVEVLWNCNGYRLPTEAEWEYAARAGVSMSTPFGDLDSGSCDCASDSKLELSAWYCGNAAKVQDVAQKMPNGWGLYDVLGNVAEWTLDNNGYFGFGVQTDPVGAIWGRGGVVRGGGYASQKKAARFGDRAMQPKTMRSKAVGFRPVRTVFNSCMPQCAGKVCGPDGCGGECGTCLGGQACVSGACVWPTLGTCLSGMCFAPNGGYRMGASATDTCQSTDEVPSHVVHLSKGFWVMQTEVTREDWASLVGAYSSWADGCGANCPVSWVSFGEAAYYANMRSIQEGYEPCYNFATNCVGNPGACVGSGSCAQPFTCAEVESLGPTCTGYRLPTEAEWEYMARAGTTTDLYNGNLIQCTGVASLLTGIAVHGGAASPAAVGGRMANPWGILDVAGNVSEWVEDNLMPYVATTQTDPFVLGLPRCPSSRGGSFKSEPNMCRHAARLAFGLCGTFQADDIGFRLVRTLFDVCVPDCFQRSCGDDGCGGTCGPPCGAWLDDEVLKRKEVGHEHA